MKTVQLFRALAISSATCVCLAAPTISWASSKLTIVVAVIDSLMPHEVNAVMPNVNALKQSGTWYTQSRSVFSAETIPNHVSMMTGTYPENNGIPTNKFWNRVLGEGEYEDDLSLPTELEQPTLFELIPATCGDQIVTGAAMSKEYLWQIFSECDGGGAACAPDDVTRSIRRQADYHWASPLYIPESGHILDPYTGQAALRYLQGGTPTPQCALPANNLVDSPLPGGPNPDGSTSGCGDEVKPGTFDDATGEYAPADFLFINFGDVDRLGHTDPSGSAQESGSGATDVIGGITDAIGEAGLDQILQDDLDGLDPNLVRARTVALADVDQEIGKIRQNLEASGRWANTIMFVLSDHGMDWKPVDANYGGVDLEDEITVGGAGADGGGFDLRDDAVVFPPSDATCCNGMREVANAGTSGLYLENRSSAADWVRAVNVHKYINDKIANDADGSYPAEFAYFVYDPTQNEEIDPAPDFTGFEDELAYIRANLIPGQASKDPKDTSVEGPINLGLAKHENLGDIVVSANKGYAYGSPLPGNHGHRLTLHNTMLVSGGSPLLRAQSVPARLGAPQDPEDDGPAYTDTVNHLWRGANQSENVDVGATVAWLLGMPLDEFDGRVLYEAFNLGEPVPTPDSCGDTTLWESVSSEEARELLGLSAQPAKPKPRCKGCKVERSPGSNQSKPRPRCRGCKVKR